MPARSTKMRLLLRPDWRIIKNLYFLLSAYCLRGTAARHATTSLSIIFPKMISRVSLLAATRAPSPPPVILF